MIPIIKIFLILGLFSFLASREILAWYTGYNTYKLRPGIRYKNTPYSITGCPRKEFINVESNNTNFPYAFDFQAEEMNIYSGATVVGYYSYRTQALKVSGEDVTISFSYRFTDTSTASFFNVMIHNSSYLGCDVKRIAPQTIINKNVLTKDGSWHYYYYLIPKATFDQWNEYPTLYFEGYGFQIADIIIGVDTNNDYFVHGHDEDITSLTTYTRIGFSQYSVTAVKYTEHHEGLTFSLLNSTVSNGDRLLRMRFVYGTPYDDFFECGPSTNVYGTSGYDIMRTNVTCRMKCASFTTFQIIGGPYAEINVTMDFEYDPNMLNSLIDLTRVDDLRKFSNFTQSTDGTNILLAYKEMLFILQNVDTLNKAIFKYSSSSCIEICPDCLKAECLRCPNCANCTRSSGCIFCAPEFFMHNGACISSCPLGFRQNSVNRTCDKITCTGASYFNVSINDCTYCPLGCVKCNQFGCLECDPQAERLSSGFCLMKCNSDQFTNHSNECKPKPINYAKDLPTSPQARPYSKSTYKPDFALKQYDPSWAQSTWTCGSGNQGSQTFEQAGDYLTTAAIILKLEKYSLASGQSLTPFTLGNENGQNLTGKKCMFIVNQIFKKLPHNPFNASKQIDIIIMNSIPNKINSSDLWTIFNYTQVLKSYDLLAADSSSYAFLEFVKISLNSSINSGYLNPSNLKHASLLVDWSLPDRSENMIYSTSKMNISDPDSRSDVDGKVEIGLCYFSAAENNSAYCLREIHILSK